MNSKDEESNFLNRLENIEKRIESMEESLNRLVQDPERRTERREAGLLVLGIILGGLLSISVNLWTDYYVLVVSPKMDISPFVALTVALVALFGYLLWWARKQLR